MPSHSGQGDDGRRRRVCGHAPHRAASACGRLTRGALHLADPPTPVFSVDWKLKPQYLVPRRFPALRGDEKGSR